MRLLDRYLLEEVTAPFVIGVLILLVMLLGDQLYRLLELLITHDVPLATIGRLLLFLLPEMMVMGMPLATVLAISLGVGRLQRENEWSMMRLGGASLGRLLAPMLAFGVIVAAANWVVAEHIAPVATAQFNRIRNELAQADPTVVVEPQRWFKPSHRSPSFYVNSVDRQTGVLEQVIVFSARQTDFPIALFAKRARYERGAFVLSDVVRHVWRPDGTLSREGHSAQVILPIQRLTPSVTGSPLAPSEMSAAQLREMVEEQLAQGIQRPDQIIDLHRKYAGPVACLILALLSVPVNLLLPHRGGYMGLLVTSVLAIVYFLLMQFGESLARTGMLQDLPVLGAWLHNIVFGVVALALLARCR